MCACRSSQALRPAFDNFLVGTSSATASQSECTQRASGSLADLPNTTVSLLTPSLLSSRPHLTVSPVSSLSLLTLLIPPVFLSSLPVFSSSRLSLSLVPLFLSSQPSPHWKCSARVSLAGSLLCVTSCACKSRKRWRAATRQCPSGWPWLSSLPCSQSLKCERCTQCAFVCLHEPLPVKWS